MFHCNRSVLCCIQYSVTEPIFHLRHSCRSYRLFFLLLYLRLICKYLFLFCLPGCPPPSENFVMSLPHAMDGVMEKHIVSASIPDNILFFIEIPPSDPDLVDMYIRCFRILLNAMSFHSPVRFLLPVIITDFLSFDNALFGTKKCPRIANATADVA